MKNMTQKKFFIIYSILLLIAIEIFMILAINIILANNSTLITILVIIFLAPFLGSIITMTTVKKHIGTFTEKNFNKILLRCSIVIYILGYIIVLKPNMLLVCAYIIGSFTGYLINQKRIEKNIEKESFFDTNKKIKSFEFERFDSHNIAEFLKINHITNVEYIIVRIKPIKKKYVLWKKTLLKPIYLMCLDNKYTYFFELSKKTKKYIEKGYVIETDKFAVKKEKENIFRYQLEVELEQGNVFNLYIPKRYFGLNEQKENMASILERIVESSKK